MFLVKWAYPVPPPIYIYMGRNNHAPKVAALY